MTKNNSLLGLILLPVFILLVLLWLFSPDSFEKRLQAAAAQNQINIVSASSRDFIADMVREIFAATEQATKFSVDDIYNTDSLRILTYRSDQPHDFNFGSGNAVFNSRKDVILLDASLVEAETAFGADSEKHQRITGYLFFVLAHEIGHRQLHSQFTDIHYHGMIESSDTSAIKREDQADAYALNALRQLLKQKKSAIKTSILESVSSTYGAPPTSTEENGELYLSTAAILREAAQYYLHGRSPFPPYFSDHKHLPFTARATALLNNPTIFNSLNQELAAHRQTVSQWFERIESMSHGVIKEIVADRPISSASFVGDGWILISDDSWTFFPNGRVVSFAGHHQRRAMVPCTWQHFSQTGMASNAILHALRDTDGNLHIIDLWSGVATSLHDGQQSHPPTATTKADFHFPAFQPSAYIYSETSSHIHIFDGAWQTIAKSDLLADHDIANKNFSLSISGGTDHHIFGVITSVDDAIVGNFTLPITNPLQTQAQISLHSAYPLNKKKPYYAGDLAEPYYLLAPANESDTNIDFVSLTAQLIKSHPIVTHDTALRKSGSSLWYSYPSVWIMMHGYAPGGSLYITYADDSLYTASLAKGVQHVCTPEVLPIPLANGQFGLVPGGHCHSAYVIAAP